MKVWMVEMLYGDGQSQICGLFSSKEGALKKVQRVIELDRDIFDKGYEEDCWYSDGSDKRLLITEADVFD